MNKDEKHKLSLMCFAVAVRITLENYPGIEAERLMAELVFWTMDGLKSRNLVDLIEPQQFFTACGFCPEIQAYLTQIFKDGKALPRKNMNETAQKLLEKTGSWFEIKDGDKNQRLSHEQAVSIKSFAEENNIDTKENFETFLSLLGVEKADFLRALN